MAEGRDLCMGSSIGNRATAGDDQHTVTISDTDIGRTGWRAVVVALSALALVLFADGPAGAHVEVSAPGAQAGTGPVTVSFVAEAESTTAGIVSAKVQLPAGIEPDHVALASGPAGWTLAPTQDGYEVSGPDIGPGVDLEYGVTIQMLPRDTTELPFKTLLRYAGGREDAWIELPSDANPEPQQPAPTLSVATAPPLASSSAPSAPDSDTPSPSPPAESDAAPSTDVVSATKEDYSAIPAWVVTTLVALAAVAVAAAVWFWRGRKPQAR